MTKIERDAMQDFLDNFILVEPIQSFKTERDSETASNVQFQSRNPVAQCS